MNVDITPAASADDLATARALFREYAGTLDVDLCVQGFEEELATLPGAYAPPRGRLLLARVDGSPAGCVALRPLDKELCEMKRLYVRPAFRGLSLGRRLVELLLSEARQAGYRWMVLDTLPSMQSAQALYRSVGFEPVAPYYHSPHPQAVYMGLTLA
jgi:ribosomal protein S18 acetylase RimI-like enzyme